MGEGLVEGWGQDILGRQPKQAVNEFDLILDSSGLNLSLPYHVHRLVALYLFSATSWRGFLNQSMER